MPGMAAKVVITERQQAVLQAMVWSRSGPRGLAHRAEIVVLAFAGCKKEGIAVRPTCERHGVGVWRKRRQKAFQRLAGIEGVEKPAALLQANGQVLGDLPRAGCGGKFTAEPIAQIVAVAREPPETSGRPVTHRTPRESAHEAIKRGIVPSISARQVGRFFKRRSGCSRIKAGTGSTRPTRIPTSFADRSSRFRNVTKRHRPG